MSTGVACGRAIHCPAKVVRDVMKESIPDDAPPPLVLGRGCWRACDGKDGDTFPTTFNTNPPVNTGAKGSGTPPLGAYTIGHGLGYAMLYQLTGEQT